MLPRVQSFVQQVSHKPAMRLEVAGHLGHRVVQASFLPTNSGQREGTGWFPPLYTGSQAPSWSALRHPGTHTLRGYYTHRAIEFPFFDPSLPCISYLRPLLPLTLSPLAGHFLPSFLGGWLSLDVPFHGCIYSCWGCFEEDQTKRVFPELRVLGILCIRGQTPGIERYPTSLLAASH